MISRRPLIRSDEPQQVSWSAQSDPETWKRPNGNGVLRGVVYEPKRGYRPFGVAPPGVAFENSRADECVTVYIPWRKFKRMWRKLTLRQQ